MLVLSFAAKSVINIVCKLAFELLIVRRNLQDTTYTTASQPNHSGKSKAMIVHIHTFKAGPRAIAREVV